MIHGQETEQVQPKAYFIHRKQHAVENCCLP